jgi:TolB-like protein/DNA-binding winged helix-turn-helix (wHTH) protein/Flp pilus assembly protein TadD
MTDIRKYSLGDFDLDPGNYSLVRDSLSVPISRKRFHVLLYLIEQRHRVVTRQELVERFWDGHEVYEENLTKCISEVRKALDDQQKPHRFIETVPAIGYRYIGPLEERPATPEFSGVESEAVVPLPILEEQAPPPVPPVSKMRTRAAVAVLVAATAVLAATAAILYTRIPLRAAADNPAAIHSLAILPFKPISEQHRDEFLELGMADALITKLSNIRQVAVASTGSVRKYIDLTQDPIAAGKELRVESVLEGSIQRLHDRIRVTARLLKVSDGSCLWAETFDEEFADIFTLQDAISEKVAGLLVVHLTTSERERITRRYTENREAWELYQKGRYFWNKRTEDGLKKSIGFFEEAIRQDPNYALAYAGLADSYLVQFTFLPPKDVYPKAKHAAFKALQIDDALAEPHAALAFATMIFDWDWKQSEREFQRTFELNPNDGLARQRYAVSLAAVGRMNEAISEAKRAQDAEPLSLSLIANTCWVSFLARDYGEAIEQCNKSIEMDPSFAPAYIYRAMAYEQKGMFDKAIADLETARGLKPGPALFGALGHAYGMSGNETKAQMVLVELEELSGKRYFPAYQMALVHVALGQNDEALALLEKAYEDRYPWLILLNVEPRLDPIRSDPRFADFVDRIGL